jgi:hypothetical protein
VPAGAIESHAFGMPAGVVWLDSTGRCVLSTFSAWAQRIPIDSLGSEASGIRRPAGSGSRPATDAATRGFCQSISSSGSLATLAMVEFALATLKCSQCSHRGASALMLRLCESGCPRQRG